MYEIKYRSEDEMKDSGIEWLGMIPEDWDTKKIKYIISDVKSGIWGDDEKQNKNDIPCVRVNNFNRNKNIVEVDNLTIRNLDKIKQRDYLLKKYDLLIEKSGGGPNQPVGFITMYESDMSAIYANFMARISIDKDNQNKYILYYFRYLYDKRINAKYINQTTGIQNINITGYFNEKISTPIAKEQQKIANFLDLKTAKFDSIISKKELLIQRLEEAKKSLVSEVVTGKVKVVDGEFVARRSDEMKDSGVEWLGMIPKGWGVKKLKHITFMQSGESITHESINFEGTYPVYGGNGLRGFTENFTHNGEYILIGRQGALCGNINYATGRFWASEHAIVLKLDNNINIYWLGELLRSMNLNQYSIAAAQPGLSVGVISNLYIPYVCEETQNKLSKFLMEKTNKNNIIITKTKIQIQKLKQAKQSLISESVPGKIDLRDWEIQEL